MRFPGGAALNCWDGGVAWAASSEKADGNCVTTVNHFYKPVVIVTPECEPLHLPLSTVAPVRKFRSTREAGLLRLPANYPVFVC